MISKNSVNVKVQLFEEYSKRLAKLDERKLYIIHVKLNVRGLKLFLNPYAFLIQIAAFLNNEHTINHTALIYGIYKDKVLGKSAKFIEATLFGLKTGSFWSLVDKVHSNGGEIWLEEVEGLFMERHLRKWLQDFVEKRLLGKKYNILKAIGSQDFKSKYLIPINFLFNLLGIIGSKKDGFFCTEVVKIIIDAVSSKVKNSTKRLTAKRMNKKKASHIHPAELFGKFSKPQKFL